jgi:hypothetical protein
MSWVAAGIYNLDSQRFRKASLDTRSEGWTETWGNKRYGTTNEETNTSSEENGHERNLEIDEEALSQLLSSPYPQVEIVLTQHRPAWFEQMLFRVAGIPHIVLNSNHISNEATGQLPYLRDCAPSKPPVLVGRNHPSNIKKSDNIIDNSILSYLQSYRNVDLDRQAGITTDKQLVLSRCFQYMIHLELSKILLHLRVEDPDAWEQVYLEQYVASSNIECEESSGTVSWVNTNLFAKLRGRFQALMEQNVERKRLMGCSQNGDKKSIHQLLERANEAYYAIDRQLLCIIKEQNETKPHNNYLLGTDRPALVDVLLWAHLAEALCDVHLVVLLASYPRLIKYFQDMYQSYFSSFEGEPNVTRAWKEWNEKQNFSNAFQKIPTLSKRNQTQCSMFKDAVDLMQKSSLQKENLQEVLDTVKVLRVEERRQKPRELESFPLYRWSMGETSEREPTVAEKEQDNPLRRKLLRDQVRNDQMWISGIFCISAVAVILIRGGI